MNYFVALKSPPTKKMIVNQHIQFFARIHCSMFDGFELTKIYETNKMITWKDKQIISKRIRSRCCFIFVFIILIKKNQNQLLYYLFTFFRTWWYILVGFKFSWWKTFLIKIFILYKHATHYGGSNWKKQTNNNKLD